MIEVIPPGSSAVVTDRYDHHDRQGRKQGRQEQVVNVIERGDRGDRRDYERNHDVEIIEAVKDADAHLTGQIGESTASLERSSGLHYGNTVAAVKDAAASLERSSGLHYGNTITAVKDTEARLQMAEAGSDRANGIRYADTVKTVKDVEAQLERSAGTRYGNTLEAVKESECTTEKVGARTIDVVRQSELATEKARGRIVEAIKDSDYRNEKSECMTRELVGDSFQELSLQNCQETDLVKSAIQEARKELGLSIVTGFKDNLIEFKVAQGVAYQIAAAADKTACANQTQLLLQFKDQAMLTQQLACQASKELAECCCEIKELVRGQADETRALINSLEQDRLRERATKAEAALNALFARGVPPVTPAQ